MVTSMIASETQHAFVLVGLPGAGKTSVAQYIREYIETEQHYPTGRAEVSAFVREYFGNQADSDNELGKLAAEKKSKYGNDYFVRQMVTKLRCALCPHVVISGVRSPEEAEAVRDHFGDEHTTVIAIWTLPDKRFERKYGDVPSKEHPEWESFQERNERELHEWGALDFFADEELTDYVLPNNGTFTAVEMDLQDIIDHEAFGQDLPPEWVDDFYPFPERDKEVVAQYL